MQESDRNYIDNLIRYQQAANTMFSPDASDEEIITTLTRISQETRDLKARQDGYLKARLVPLERGETAMTEEDFLNLSEFAAALSDGRITLDNIISFRVRRLLLHYAEEQKNYDRIMEELYWCGICQWKHSDYTLFNEPKVNPYFDQVLHYAEHFKDLSQEGRSYYLRAMVNRILRLNNRRPAPLLAVCEEVWNELARIRAAYPDTKFNFRQAEMTVIRNTSTAICGFRKGQDTTPENTQLVEKCAERVLELNGLNVNVPSGTVSNYYYTLYCARFHAGQIDLDTLLQALDRLSVPDEEKYSTRENFLRVFHMTSAYVEYLNLYSDLSREEIADLVRRRLERVTTYASRIRLDEEYHTLNRHFVNFAQSAATALPFRNLRHILFELTVHCQRSTYLHTLSVRDICLAVLDGVLEQNPAALAGVLHDASAEYISSHKEEIRAALSEMALFHDVGKYRCVEIISNASRRLEDEEFAVIQHHPEFGMELLDTADTPREILDAARYHHRWHDGTGGYPKQLPPTPNQPLIDILSIADSLDAATDLLGRAYANPKTLDDLIEEFESQRDTRYAGFVIDVLRNPSIHDAVEDILNNRRRHLLCEVSRKQGDAYLRFSKEFL